jgi:iron complex transport system substrate-binding protein
MDRHYSSSIALDRACRSDRSKTEFGRSLSTAALVPAVIHEAREDNVIRFTRRAALAAPLAAALGVALSKSALATLQEGPSAELPVTVTDVTGNEVTVEDITRIIPLSGDVAEIVWALGLGQNIVAVDVSAVYPEPLLALPKIGFERDLSAEGILAMEPTIVIGKEQAGPPPVLEQVRGAGVPVVLIAEPQTIEAPASKIRAVAEALGVSEAGEALASQVEEEIASVENLVADVEERPRVLLVYLRGPGTQLVGGAGTVSEAMIETAGGIDAGAETGIQGFAPLTAEAIVTAAPDIILTTTSGVESIGGIEGMLQIPGIADTPAAQAAAIHALDDSLLLAMTPRVGQALNELVAIFHPDLAPAVGTPEATPEAA